MNPTLATTAGAVCAIFVLGAGVALGYERGATKTEDTGNSVATNAVVSDQPKVLKVQQVNGFTPLVTNAAGRTVYRFDNDSAKPSRTTCFDECAKTWEPVLAGSGVVVDGGGIDQAKLGTIDRPEGKQVTLKGWPLYYFVKDKTLGQTAGHGVGDVWFAVSPQGGKAKTATPRGGPGTGPGKPGVQVLTVNTVDGFMPFVTNGKGRTIYRFDNDTANPSRTSCFDDCAKTWEPVLAGANGFEVKGSKIDASDVGTIDRPEGKQLTLKGWPLYYFAKDKTLGQTAGYGKGNVWFAIAPDGKKAPRCP